LSEFDTPGLATAVAVNADGQAMVADWFATHLVDLSDLSEPKLIARELAVPGSLSADDMGQSLGVAHAGGTWHILGLNSVSRLDIHPEIIVPELTLGRNLIQIQVLEGEMGSTGLLFPNTGRAALEVTNIKLGDPRLELTDKFGSEDKEGIDIYVDAADTGFLAMSAEGSEPFDTTLSFNTNDPDYPLVSLTVQINPKLVQVGDAAPDFTLPGVYGEMIRMDELKGQVVYMKLFNGL
jgi:hypothetical protein